MTDEIEPTNVSDAESPDEEIGVTIEEIEAVETFEKTVDLMFALKEALASSPERETRDQ